MSVLIAENAAVTESRTAQRRESVAGTEASKGPVLVLDADPAIRRVVRLVLEGAGWRCLTASTLDDARRLIVDECPKFVLAEVKLSGEDVGADLACEVAENGGWRPRVALMSAYPRPQRSYEDYFFPKPLEFDRLIGILESVESEPGW